MNEIEYIHLFLEGKLNGGSLKEFEQKMKEDHNFREKVEEYETIFSGMKNLRQEAFEQKVRKWNETLPPNIQSSTISFLSNTVLRRVAATLFIIALAGVAYWFYQSSESLKSFGTENYIALQLDLNRHEDNSTDYQGAELAFDDEKFENCISLTKNIQATDSFYLKALYLKGHALYQSKQYQEAIATFDQIANLKNKGNYYTKNVDKDIAEWTSILSQLALYQSTSGKIKKANLIQQIELFLEQNFKDDYYKRKAKQLKSLLQ